MEDNASTCVIEGTCMLMCPASERRLRETERLLHPFEMIDGTEKHRRPRAHSKRIVKSYSRSAAGKLDPESRDLRPLSVLEATVKYLMTSVAVKTDVHWVMVYNYVVDRLRAVRQDAIILRCSGAGMQYILEQSVQFHIYAGYRLCEEPISRYDAKLNETHALECMKRLLVLYKLEGDLLGHRSQFEAAYQLYNLGSEEPLHHFVQLKDILRTGDDLTLTWNICLSHLRSNYVRTLRLALSLPPLLMCAFHRHLNSIQKYALMTMSHGFSSKNLHYPLHHLVDILQFNNTSEAENFCGECGIGVLTGGKILFTKGGFRCEDKIVCSRWNKLDQKLSESLSPPNFLQ